MSESPNVYEFPCPISIKSIGDDRDDYLQFVIDTMVAVVGKIEVQAITTRSSNGNKYLAVTVPFFAKDRKQLEAVFQALNKDVRTKFIV